jgi:hypothetical protein
VQFMAEHGVNNPGNFTYHHCADLQITADPTKPIDMRWPPETLPHILDVGVIQRTWPEAEPLAERRRTLVPG